MNSDAHQIDLSARPNVKGDLPKDGESEELQRLRAEFARQTAELQRANRTLSDSEQRLRLAVAAGGVGLWVWNSTDVANAGDWSPRLKEIFGLPLHAEVTHEIFLERVHPEDRERVNDGVMQALSGANGGDYACEYRAVRRDDGALRWVTARGQAFFDAEGRAIRFIGTVIDITDRKRGEESASRLNLELEKRIAERTADLACINATLLGEIEERKRVEEELTRNKRALLLAIDTIPGLVWSSLPDGQIEYLNQRWLDYTGLTLEQARGWGWQQAIHPDDLLGLVEYWTSILTAGNAGEYEARLRRHDGQFRWFLFRGVPLHDASGVIVKWYGTNTDVEAWRASEHLARGQIDALSRLMEALGQESDPDQLPKHVLNTILTQLGAASVTIWERNGDNLDLLGVDEEGRFRPRRETGYFEGSIPVEGHAPPLWIEALRTGGHTLVEDIDKEPSRIILADGRTAIWTQADLTAPFANLKVHLLAQGVRGLLISPMILAGHLAGIIGIRFKGTRVFGREEIELTKALAYQAMLALQLMRLSQQSRRAAVLAERNRLARDIHDTLAQGFTGVIVQLEAAEDAKARHLPAEMDAHLQRAGELARASLQEARRSVQALRPQALEEKKLVEALDALFREMTNNTGLQCKFAVSGEPQPLPPEWEENLLRICQEVSTNVLRHAQATTLRVQILYGPRDVRFELRDDGRGFNPDKKHDGFGLVGMRERVEAMGGRLALESVLGKGTSIAITLPIATSTA